MSKKKYNLMILGIVLVPVVVLALLVVIPMVNVVVPKPADVVKADLPIYLKRYDILQEKSPIYQKDDSKRGFRSFISIYQLDKESISNFLSERSPFKDCDGCEIKEWQALDQYEIIGENQFEGSDTTKCSKLTGNQAVIRRLCVDTESSRAYYWLYEG